MKPRKNRRQWLVGLTGLVLGFGSPALAQGNGGDACASVLAYSQARDGLSLRVERGGQLVCSHETAPGQAYELYSGTKSFVGLAAAAAVQDGLLRLDEPVADTLPEWRGDRLKQAVTVRQLIGMVSGLPSQVGRPPSYADAVAAPFTHAPGEKFQYGPAPMQVFGEVLRRKLAAKQMDADPLAYIERRLLTPLDIHYAQWRRGADGQPLMPQGASFTPEQWAKVGRFVLSGGQLGGQPLVDGGAFKALFSATAANPSYGLTWWLAQGPPSNDAITRTIDIGASGRLPKDLVLAAGAGGQRLYVIPSRRLIIVRQARFDVAAALAGRGRADREPFSDTAFLELLLKSLDEAKP